MASVVSVDLSTYLHAISQPAAWFGRHIEYRYPADSSTGSCRFGSVPAICAPPPCDSVDEDAATSTALADGASESGDVATAEATMMDACGGDSGFSSDSSSEEADSSSTSSAADHQQQVGVARKHVSFADDVGLALVSVRRYDPRPPLPPPTPFSDDDDSDDDAGLGSVQRCRRRRPVRLEPAFRQPWFDAAAMRSRLGRDGVALESVFGRGRGLLFGGSVVVANLAYDKRVAVRCTFDAWRSFADVGAVYATSSAATDLFTFEVLPSVGHQQLSAAVGSLQRRGAAAHVEFAVCYRYRDYGSGCWVERWDNNDGRNYRMVATW